MKKPKSKPYKRKATAQEKRGGIKSVWVCKVPDLTTK